MFLLFIACCATMWWVMLDLHKANEEEVRRRHIEEALQQKYSLPKTDDDLSPDSLPAAPPPRPTP
jgi:hypothetical protein